MPRDARRHFAPTACELRTRGAGRHSSIDMTPLSGRMGRRVGKRPAGLRHKLFQGEPRRMTMSTESSSFSRRTLLATTAAAGAFGLVGAGSSSTPARAAEGDIRPFRINVPEEAL